MRYDEMHRLYPVIEEYFEQVADQVRSGVLVRAVLDFLGIRIQSEIKPQHQKAVADKLAYWAGAVRSNNDYLRDIATLPEPEPELCPYCESNETTGGVCGWCHSKIAG